MKVSVWGDELAAWVVAAQLAAFGNEVQLCAGEVWGRTEAGKSIYPSHKAISAEPGLMELLQEGYGSGRLRAVPADEAFSAPVHWLGMAPDRLDEAVDLIRRIAEGGAKPCLVVNQSNFGIGASDRLQSLLDLDAGQAVVCLPDSLQEGNALAKFGQPDALLLGCEDESARRWLLGLLRPFTGTVRKVQLMTRREAEFTKFAISGMLALRLGYINELANLADLLGVDIEVVRQGMGTDERIGTHYLAPGCGFGGQHFTQYIEGLAELLSEKRRSSLLETVLIENQRQMELPFRKLWQHYQCDIRGKTVALWGLAFKPGVASIDNAPSLRIIDALLAQGARVRLHDPEALVEIRKHYGAHPQLTCCDDNYEAAEGADALLLVTEWPEYWSPDFGRLAQSMHARVIVDGRNVYDPGLVREYGFAYYGIGRV